MGSVDLISSVVSKIEGFCAQEAGGRRLGSAAASTARVNRAVEAVRGSDSRFAIESRAQRIDAGS
jgi:hypothetical protein